MPIGGLSSLDVLFGGEVAEVHIHLPDVVMLHVVQLQVDQHEATQDAVIEDEIDVIVRVVERDSVLPADERESFAELQ